jgi:uncharacterized membrane protein YecN with MAPEG domain
MAALLLVGFAVLVIRCRLRQRVVIGDGGDDLMIRHMRAHANFAEYAPLILILLLTLDLLGTNAAILHGLGSAFIIGRISHFYSLTVVEPKTIKGGNMNIKFRQFGMMLTFFVIVTAVILLLVNYFRT